jgi:glycerophosphoryl diester phosphodiesterase
MLSSFDLQGHRGARGLKPENTLPSFEVAIDLGVNSVETDVHLTRDGVPVLIHDERIDPTLFRLSEDRAAPPATKRSLVSSLTLAQLRGYRADGNPDSRRFPTQDALVTPLAAWFADQHGLDPFAPPALTDLLAFVEAYAKSSEKTPGQKASAASLRFDLELKRVPFYPAYIGDEFDGVEGALLERQVLAAVKTAGVIERTTVRSFDHRSVLALRRMEPRLTGAVLVAHTAPIAPAELARLADASVYCPGFEFLDAAQVRQAHQAGVRVLPWTVNEPADWARLIEWGVDGITTDYPDRLAVFLGRTSV